MTTMRCLNGVAAGKMMMMRKAFPDDDGCKNHDVEASVSFWRTRMPQQTPSHAGTRAAGKIPKKEKTCETITCVCTRARVRKRRVYFMRAFGGIDYSTILSSFWLLLLPLYNLLLRYATTKYLPLFRVGGGCSLRRRDSLCLFLSLSSFGIQPTMLLFLPLARTSSYLLNASLLFPHVSFQVRKHSCQTRAPSRECAETRERSRTYKSTPISSSPTIWVLDKPKSITYMESVCA